MFFWTSIYHRIFFSIGSQKSNTDGSGLRAILVHRFRLKNRKPKIGFDEIVISYRGAEPEDEKKPRFYMVECANMTFPTVGRGD